MTIGIIGFGSLGRSLASGLRLSGFTEDIFVCESSPEARELAQREPFCAKVSDDVNFVVKNSDVIFLVVKYYVFEQLAPVIDKGALAGKTVVSFMAGMTLEDIAALIGGEAELVRAMPSIAIAACDGVIGYTKAPANVAAIFHKLGLAFEVEPQDIRKVMAFAGCGPGLAANLLDAFAEAGAQMGFSPEDCAKITALTFKSVIERDTPFKDTVKAVATPGGATEQGVLYMEQRGVRDILAQTMREAYDKMV